MNSSARSVSSWCPPAKMHPWHDRSIALATLGCEGMTTSTDRPKSD